MGGFTTQKQDAGLDYFSLTHSNARFWLDESSSEKGTRAGFAVGSFSKESKNDPVEFMDVTPENYFIGHSAGASNVTGLYSKGSDNVIIGTEAGQSKIETDNTGSLNVIIGRLAGYYNTTGSSNVILGSTAGYSNITGFSNVFFGNSAGYSNTSGYQNTFIGYGAGSGNTTGNNNVYIGNYSGGEPEEDNQLAIGNLIKGNFGYHTLELNATVTIEHELSSPRLSANNMNVGELLVLDPQEEEPTSPIMGTVFLHEEDSGNGKGKTYSLKIWIGEWKTISWGD